MTQFTSFFAELINRLRSKSPKFFLILQITFAIGAFLSYVPSMMQRWFEVAVPGGTIHMFEDIAKYCTGAFVMTLLPVATKPVGQTPEGHDIHVTDEKRLPFTAKVEDKIMPPPPTIPEVPEKPAQ